MQGGTSMANATPQAMRRPSRWDVPFDDGMTEGSVDQLVGIEPFASIEPAAFPRPLPLRGILLNDARIVHVEPGDLIIREGDYGSSAFLIIDGSALVCLDPLQSLPSVPGKKTGKLTLVERLRDAIRKQPVAEYRDVDRAQSTKGWKQRTTANETRLFVQDVPRILREDRTISLGEGEIFGELAALTRAPRSASVIAETAGVLLEIRWQGLRDLIRFDGALKQHVERLYRQNSLNVHLRETPLLKRVPPESIQRVADATRFESFGDFDWHHDFRATRDRDVARRVESEPRIAGRGDYPDGLILIRSGFARLSRPSGIGEETVAYLGKGHVFGLEELWHNWKRSTGHPLVHTLRAIGYVDILRIPTNVLEDDVFPHVDAGEIEFAFEVDPKKRSSQERLEFLVDQRLFNGTQAMVIDLDRCTRCDDCLRACSAAHQGNPRFVRSGPVHEGLMFAGACMHCVDPVCMIGCPTGAISRSAETGTVVIQDETCIGCSTCANSCPYDNIRMVEIRDAGGGVLKDEETGLSILKATKCDLCQDQPLGPACQRGCPHDALVRIDLQTIQPLEKWTQR